jgi:hypothetical protein
MAIGTTSADPASSALLANTDAAAPAIRTAAAMEMIRDMFIFFLALESFA